MQACPIYGSCFPYALDALPTDTLFLTSADGNRIVTVHHVSSHPGLCPQGHGYLTLHLSLPTELVFGICLISLPSFLSASMGKTLTMAQLPVGKRPQSRTLPPGPCSKQTRPAHGLQVSPPEVACSPECSRAPPSL